jgi:hypothetical protein
MYAETVEQTEQGTMNGTLNKIALKAEKVIRIPVKGGPCVGTAIAVGHHFIPYAHHKGGQRLLTLLQGKLTARRVDKLIDVADHL